MILNDVRILAGDSLVRKDVEIKGGVITRVEDELGKGENCTGKLLLPGFANSHTHMASRLLSGVGRGLNKFEYFTRIGFKAHGIRTREDVYNAALLAGIEYLKTGVTNVLTMDVHPEPVIEALEALGMNYLIGYPLKDSHEQAQNIDKSFNMIDRLARKHKDKVYVGLANEIECTPKLIKDSLDFARERDLHIHMHACETKEEVLHIKQKTGMRTIDYLQSLGLLDYDLSLAHCTYCDTKDFMNLSNHDITVIHCPTSNYEISRNLPDVKYMINREINVGIGTDEYPWNPKSDVREEALKALRSGINYGQAMNLLWGGHELWGEHGVRVGLPANLIMIDLWKVKPYINNESLYHNILKTDSINSVIINGEYKIKNHKLVPKIDERKLRQAVEGARQKILERL